MTEAIASDPGFMEIAKEMQESMLAGMGNMNLNDEVGHGDGVCRAGNLVFIAHGLTLRLPQEDGPSMPGGFPGGMPDIDPTKYMSAMQRVMGNPDFMAAAESLGKNLMNQVKCVACSF